MIDPSDPAFDPARVKVIACATVIEEMAPRMPAGMASEVLEFGLHLHPGALTPALLPRAESLGWFQFSDIFKVKEVVGDTMAIIGGMRNSLLQAGTPEEVRATTRRVCEVVGEGGGFVMCPAIGEMEGCRPDLVKVWVDTTKEFAN